MNTNNVFWFYAIIAYLGAVALMVIFMFYTINLRERLTKLETVYEIRQMEKIVKEWNLEEK
jgi:hypothetical protein